MARLRPILAGTGIPNEQLHEFTSHCFRQGSRVDILEAHGVAAMVALGGWSSPQAAEPYASADGQQAVGLVAVARTAIDLSDDGL